MSFLTKRARASAAKDDHHSSGFRSQQQQGFSLKKTKPSRRVSGSNSGFSTGTIAATGPVPSARAADNSWSTASLRFDNNETCVFVGDLALDTSPHELLDAFRDYGSHKAFVKSMNDDKSKNTTYGFVWFSSKEETKAVLEVKSIKVNNLTVIIRPRTDSTLRSAFAGWTVSGSSLLRDETFRDRSRSQQASISRVDQIKSLFKAPEEEESVVATTSQHSGQTESSEVHSEVSSEAPPEVQLKDQPKYQDADCVGNTMMFDTNISWCDSSFEDPVTGPVPAPVTDPAVDTVVDSVQPAASTSSNATTDTHVIAENSTPMKLDTTTQSSDAFHVFRVENIPGRWTPEFLFKLFSLYGEVKGTFLYPDLKENGTRDGLVEMVSAEPYRFLTEFLKKIPVDHYILDVVGTTISSIDIVSGYQGHFGTKQQSGTPPIEQIISPQSSMIVGPPMSSMSSMSCVPAPVPLNFYNMMPPAPPSFGFAPVMMPFYDTLVKQTNRLTMNEGYENVDPGSAFTGMSSNDSRSVTDFPAKQPQFRMFPDNDQPIQRHPHRAFDRVENKWDRVGGHTHSDSMRLDDRNSNRLYIRNIDISLVTNEDDLRILFSNQGEVTSTRLFAYRNNPDKVFGYVSYKDKESAQRAIEEMNGVRVGSFKLAVKHAFQNQKVY